MNVREIINILNKYGLKPATKRELSLLTLSIISPVYVKLLKDEIGFSYEAIAAIGGKDDFYTMLNESHIAKKTGELLEKVDFNDILKKAKDFFNDFQKGLEENTDKNPEAFLLFIAKNYSNYMLSIGLYNCFWRYLGNEKEKGKLNEKILEKISKERRLVAELYPKVEKLVKSAAEKIGEKRGFEGDLLRYLTLDELKSFLNEQKISANKLEESKLRRKGYFYLSYEDKELVFTDMNIIDEIKDKFFKVKHETNVIQGTSSYPGLVKGSVKIVFEEKDLNKIKKGDILVTPMTSPSYVTVIGKVAAIITDEGGILSHAAIVSREMKKPCVIGTKIATRVLKDGDLVEVDANKGTVKKI
jgi:phosphohistidine swiveling domain-containing protein